MRAYFNNDEIRNNLEFLFSYENYFAKFPELSLTQFRILSALFLACEEKKARQVASGEVREVLGRYINLHETTFYSNSVILAGLGCLTKHKGNCYEQHVFRLTDKAHDFLQRFFNQF